MKVKILYNRNIIKKELLFIEKNLPYFKQNKMFYYFPFDFTKNKSDKDVERQILIDEQNFKIQKIHKIISDEWAKKENIIFNYLIKYNKEKKYLDIKSQYKCFLTFYGCYGYYNYPNKVFVNVIAKPEFIIETIIHELIHLFIYKITIKKTYQEIEKIVDNIFIDSGLSAVFQKIKKL